MLSTYTYPEYAYQASAEQRSGRPQPHAVVIVGAGPIGLTAALDLASRGLSCVVIDDNNTVSLGSRGLCYAKRPLEIFDRLGVVEPMLAKGVRWQVGKVFFRDELTYQFDLLPEQHHKLPAMINLQQYYLEQYLVEACQRTPGIDLRWKHRLVGLEQDDEGVRLDVETPDGRFTMQAAWVLACDGASSDTRRLVGADFTGQFFQDRFLIADVAMKAEFPTERWFWFDPPFHGGQSVLLHKQADNCWRIDFQLGWDADPVEEKKPERVIPRIQAMLGSDARFDLEWVSVYQFACRRMERFRVGRVIFAGDSAHQVSPFGARGANTGIQDVDNLAWKLALVHQGSAPVALVDSYDAERTMAADDNLRHSTRSTDFITPKSRGSRLYRDAVLELAKTEPFARPLVNSGRLSTPTPYAASPLNTPDREAFAGAMRPGTACADAPLLAGARPGWLLDHLGHGFTLLCFGALPAQAVAALQGAAVPIRALVIGQDLHDHLGVLAQRYDAQPGTCYLIRPDQHVAARWRSFDAPAVNAALRRALALPAEN